MLLRYGLFFSGHVIFKTLLKESDRLLMFLFAFYSIFSVSMLHSSKMYHFIFFFLVSKFDEFDIDSYTTSSAGFNWRLS